MLLQKLIKNIESKYTWFRLNRRKENNFLIANYILIAILLVFLGPRLIFIKNNFLQIIRIIIFFNISYIIIWW